jgi:RNA polymerase sigma-70 factor (ECF subfamily)
MSRVPASRPTDMALMTSVQAGRRAALGELYERLAFRAYRTALAICHDRDFAQDAVQDAFLSMWSSSSTYQASRGPVAGWAMGIVRHRAIYINRHRALTARSEAILSQRKDSSDEDLPADYVAHAEHEQLAELLARLPPGQREIIQLGFFDGLTHQQIAHRLALPPGTVKGRMRLGLKKLHDNLDHQRPSI